jgi:signal transduction histidine kinase
VTVDHSSGLARRGPLILEVAVLASAATADALLTAPLGVPTAGWRQPVAAVLPSLGPAAALLVLLRRRFPDKLALLAAWVSGASLVSTTIAAAADRAGGFGHRPCACEVVALMALAGAAARRLTPRLGTLLVPACGVAGVLAALTDPGSRVTPVAVPAAAVLWAAAVGVGLLLRDADRRGEAELTRAVSAQRAALARDLHDVVAHHVTGIVVLARTARFSDGVGQARAEHEREEDTSGYAQIERAGAEALQAMRRLVSLLKTEPETTPAALRDAVTDPARAEARVRLLLADDLDSGPEDTRPVAAVVRRVTGEALTNVRRHAPEATQVRITAHVTRTQGPAVLRLDIANDGAPRPGSDNRTREGPGRSGHGVIGMKERVTALGGSCEAGPRDEGWWGVAVSIPLPAPAEGPLFLRPKGLT